LRVEDRFAKLEVDISETCRQHTSAYVSIRQHTSAYVSMRQVQLRDLPAAAP
jgi:hypothetical protein